ncbi:Uma2 family endonuclease [Streptomyces sp. RG80]|uniref:Uma2 family endonuclease n=1 Tax=Streptomyces sp. RG80 TaxID=3157340 RepID=UPI00338EB61C
MADANTERLDAWFERLERLPVPEGFRVEIVGGNVHITPQRDTHWEIIRRIVRALEDRFGRSVKVFSDVRIDFSGHENGFCPDVALLKDSATKDSEGRWRYQDVEFVADPYQGRCHIYTEPKGSEYEIETRVPFGKDLDLTGTIVDLTLRTDEFPRD